MLTIPKTLSSVYTVHTEDPQQCSAYTVHVNHTKDPQQCVHCTKDNTLTSELRDPYLYNPTHNLRGFIPHTSIQNPELKECNVQLMS
jgi:hypothetical protein